MLAHPPLVRLLVWKHKSGSFRLRDVRRYFGNRCRPSPVVSKERERSSRMFNRQERIVTTVVLGLDRCEAAGKSADGQRDHQTLCGTAFKRTCVIGKCLGQQRFTRTISTCKEVDFSPSRRPHPSPA